MKLLKHSAGLPLVISQGGSKSPVYGNTATTVDYPIAFTSIGVPVMCFVSTTENVTLRVNLQQLAKFDCYAIASSSSVVVGVRWLAFGW